MSLAERMAALRENNNFSPIDADWADAPTSLATFLTIYNKTGTECYIEYMQGAKALIAFLSPIEIPEIDAGFLATLPKPSSIAMVDGYHMYQLAKLLAGGPTELKQIAYIEKVILYLTCRHMLIGGTT